MKDLYVVYHKNCCDGFVAAWLMVSHFKSMSDIYNCHLEAVNYPNKELPESLLNIKDSEIYIVDFSYSFENVKKLINNNNKVFILDHHESAADMYSDYGGYFNGIILRNQNDVNDIIIDKVAKLGYDHVGEVTLDKEKSGAGLAYEFVFNDEADLTAITECIALAAQDYDLWKFELTDTKIIHSMLRANMDNFKYLDRISDDFKFFEEELAKAQAVYDYRLNLMKGLAAKAELNSFFEGYIVPFINCESEYASETCAMLTPNHPFVASYIIGGDKVYVSLRSETGRGVNVKQIAEQFGGGGHIHSSGFSLDFNTFASLYKFVKE